MVRNRITNARGERGVAERDEEDRRRNNAFKALKRNLKGAGSAVISYSGGLDSSFLAAIAGETIPGAVRCVILDSPLVPRRTIQEAKARAALLRIPCDVVPFPILDDPEFSRNPRNRCYICKKKGSALLLEKVREYGTGQAMDGLNASDLEEFRPGTRAADEAGILHPLADCGLGKQDIRSLAKEKGFLFWDQPSTPCLATRIAYGQELAVRDLQRIEAAEQSLGDRGFYRVRVRMHGSLARIEVPEEEIVSLARRAADIARMMRDLGFCYCTLDLEGLRSGSMDEE